MRKTMMGLVEIEKKEISYGQFETFHNADPIYCALNNASIQHEDCVGSNQRIC